MQALIYYIIWLSIMHYAFLLFIIDHLCILWLSIVKKAIIFEYISFKDLWLSFVFINFNNIITTYIKFIKAK